jgi:N-acetylmuramoyl-L-alanine amidase
MRCADGADRVAGVFRNESRGGGRRRSLVIALAVAAPLCLAGGLAYRATSGSDPASDSSARADKGASVSPWTPGSGTSADGADSTSGDSTGTGTPSTPSTAKAPPPTHAVPTPTRPPLPLAGKVVVIDPGHNPTNARHTTEINRLVNIGTNYKECDTTGTATNAGYPEASYTLDVSRRVRAILAARGAKVVFTQDGNRPYGPCVDERARIGNAAHADAALSVHADGGPSTGYGFHVIAPKSLHAGIADTRRIAAPSYLLATTLRSHFTAATGEPFANYLGGGTGLMVRDDLGGLNLSLVPKVFIECGNMRNARDAKSLTDPAWRQHAAQGIADGLTAFLEGKR